MQKGRLRGFYFISQWLNTDKGGVKNSNNFVDVICEWSQTAPTLLLLVRHANAALARD